MVFLGHCFKRQTLTRHGMVVKWFLTIIIDGNSFPHAFFSATHSEYKIKQQTSIHPPQWVVFLATLLLIDATVHRSIWWRKMPSTNVSPKESVKSINEH